MNTNEYTYWYVGYTLPKCEKLLNKLLVRDGVETFLPLQTEIKQWSDRKKKIETPLFPNYIFIKTNPKRRFDLLKHRELIRYVSFDNEPVKVGDEQIETIRTFMTERVEVRPSAERRYFGVGSEVQVSMGQFKGLKGILLKEDRADKVIIRLDSIRQDLIVHLSPQQITEYILQK